MDVLLESIRQQMEEEGHVPFIACEGVRSGGLCIRTATREKTCFTCKRFMCFLIIRAHTAGVSVSRSCEIHQGCASRPCIMETERKPQQQSGRFYEHMGMKKSKRGRFSDRKRILYERLHHAVENRRISSGVHYGIKGLHLRFQRATLRFKGCNHETVKVNCNSKVDLYVFIISPLSPAI